VRRNGRRTRLVFLLDFLLAVVEEEELESRRIVVSFVLHEMIAFTRVALNRMRIILDEFACLVRHGGDRSLGVGALEGFEGVCRGCCVLGTACCYATSFCPRVDSSWSARASRGERRPRRVATATATAVKASDDRDSL
jgi:hypothetical protein